MPTGSIGRREQGERLRAVTRAEHLVALVLQQGGNAHADRVVVVDHENASFRHGHVPSPGAVSGPRDGPPSSGSERESGSRTVKVVPAPSVLSTSIVPPCCSTVCRAAASPTPVPVTDWTLLPRVNGSKM